MRRPFRPLRPIRRAFATPPVPPLLQRANRLMAAGEYVAAAEAFEQLARGAEMRFPKHAPRLHLEAGRARLLAGQTEAGMADIKHGLQLLSAAGRWPLMRQAGDRIVAELNQRGLTAQAAEITALLQAIPAGAGDMPAVEQKKPVLPTHCPGCGGPLRADEVDWLDEVTAECSYCGSPVRAG